MLIPSKHSGYQAGIRLYPGSKGGGAPAPDPNIGKYYAKMGDISEEMWKEAKGLLPAQRRQMEQSIVAADEASANAKTDRTYALGRQKLMDDRYDTVQTPLEDKLIGLAKGYNEPAEQERMATQAGEDVAGAFRTADGQLQRGLASRGISANSGAAISAINDNSIAAAVAGASAINKTRQAAKDIGWARLGEATALGKGLVGFGQASGQASAAATGQGFQTGTAGTGIIQQGINGVNSAGSTAAGIMGSAAGGLTNLYGQQVAAYNSQQANDPMSTILGSAAGAAGTYGMAWGLSPAKGGATGQTNFGKLFA